MVIITASHIQQAQLRGACKNELARVTPGMPLDILPQDSLAWIENAGLWSTAMATEQTANTQTDVLGCIPLLLFARSGSGYGYGYGYGDGSGYGDGDGYGYGSGSGYGSSSGYGYG